MNSQALAIMGSGMVSGVGLTAPASCAAIRCGIDNFQETRFIDSGGEYIIGSCVPLEQPWRGRLKLVHLIVPAIRECLVVLNNYEVAKVPLFLCVSEEDRPGRFEGLDDKLINEVQAELGLRFHEKSTVISNGRVGGVDAMEQILKLIYQERLSHCIIAGVDTFLTAGTLRAYELKDRILTSDNSNGFIPGEAGAAVVLGAGNQDASQEMIILGIGFGREEATIDSGKPLRADGLVQAFKAALSNSGLPMGNLNYRITDANGEQYKFKEGDLAVTRMLREHKGEFDIWHPADCIGEVGAATVPCVLCVANAAARKGYSGGDNVLCHFGNDNGKRAAIILAYLGNGECDGE